MSRFRYRSLFKNESKVTNKFVIEADEDGTMSLRNCWASPVSVYLTTDEDNRVQLESAGILELIVQDGDQVVVEEVSFDTFRYWVAPSPLNVNTIQSLSCGRGFVMGVSAHVTEMPDITKFTSFADKTKGGRYMFAGFNSYGTVTSFPAGAFDLSKLTSLDGVSFVYFNFYGALTSLPVGSFNTANLTTLGAGCFWAFNARNAVLTSLPAGSFRLNPAIKSLSYFAYFNSYGALTSLPAGSFNTENITALTSWACCSFNTYGALTSLPAGSFRFDSLVSTSHYDFYSFNAFGALTSLPVGSFNMPNLVSAGARFFTTFNWAGKLKSLPDGAFNMPNLESCGYEFLWAFNAGGALTSLPEGFAYTPKLRFTNLTSATSYLGRFNGQNGKIKSLPNLSFANSTQFLNMLPNGFMGGFNGWTNSWWNATTGGSLATLPAGSFRFDAIKALSDEEFATSIGTGVFSGFNTYGRLKTLPYGSFDIGHADAGLTTATNFASSFNGLNVNNVIQVPGDLEYRGQCQLPNITNAPIKQIYVDANHGGERLILETPPGGTFQW